METIFENQYHVRSYEVDSRGKLRPVTMLDYMQDTAGDHVNRLGLSVVELMRRNLTWVVSRYHLRIEGYPQAGDTVRVRTWASGHEGPFALRDFEVLNEQGEALLVASSSWVVLNLETKRPHPLDELLAGLPQGDRRALETSFEKLPPVEVPELEVPFRVRLGDLDINQHVNHTSYVAWALETVPVAVGREYHPVEMEIGYRAEAFYGDRIISRTQVLEEGETPRFLHQLVSEKQGRELTRLRTVWGRI